MIAVDTNILVYAHRADAEFHAAAERCVRNLAESRNTWAIPWPCLHEFFAIATHPKIYAPATPVRTALEQVEAWLESPSLVLMTETAVHWQELRAVIESGRIVGAQVHDARIAALCIQHRVRELWTVDRDFTRFPQLSVKNPLKIT